MPQEGSVQSVDRALQILTLLTERESLGVSEVARHLGVHRSTAFRLLATLEAHDYVEQEGHRGTYRLGFSVLRLSTRVVARMDLAKAAQLVCDDLTEELNETSNVAILDDGAAVNITQSTSSHFVAVTQQYVGRRTPLHATSTGKVLLAFAGSIDLADLGRLESFTPATITRRSELAKHLDDVRRQGFAVAVQEWEQEMSAVAVPVIAPGGAVIAALSVTAPSFRMPAEALPEHAEQLRPFARRLGQMVGT
jgi:DNA-binding IclR family transcriptional regulator